jgi:hypothetical protein
VFIVKAATTSPFSAAGAVEGVMSSIALGAAMALVTVDLLRASDDPAAPRAAREASRPRSVPVVQDAQ